MTLLHRAARRARSWLEGLPLPALLAIGVLIATGFGAGGFYAYQTYDYVQHDNDFCISCHLMEAPFERFAQSAHRGLGCKACHRPNLIERSTMGVTQIVESPDSLGVHAEVPNSVCAGCHIEGDPEKWELIASSVGHRVHLESTDTTLEGLRCVECHSTSVHEFAPVDRTCSQSSCHTESAIELGAMSDLTIHCVACHGFSRPTPGDAGTEELSEALSPDRATCLACHQMRLLVALPDPDPHEGECAWCHNPHTQETPAEAADTCTSAGCHEDADASTPFHVGIAEEVMTDCMYCHQAHDFHLAGSNCLACHRGILEDDPAVRPRSDPAVSGAANAAGSGMALSRRRAALALHARADALSSWNDPVQAAATFLHSEHTDFACGTCHESEERHGVVSVTPVQGCRDCHHTEPTSDDCSSCHVESESTGDPYRLAQTVVLSVTGEVRRVLPFEHSVHTSDGCATCHTEGLELSARDLDCSSCHSEHHQPETSCLACHERASADAHPMEQVHFTCAGVGCHTDGPFEVVPRTRSVCLGCHQDMVDHRPEEAVCTECHALPAPIGRGP